MFMIAPISAVIALVLAVVLYRAMMRSSEGDETMRGIARDVREGAGAYLFRQYKVVSLAFLVLFIILSVLAFMKIQNPFVPVAFLTGGLFSGLCGFIGMKTATQASARTAEGCKQSLNRGLQVSFKAGSVMGLVIVGFGLLDIAVWYLLLDNFVFTVEHIENGWSMMGLDFVKQHAAYVVDGQLTDDGMQYKYLNITTTMLTFGMGASLQALFARLGGGIFTKAADVGADLVGKVEAGIPEDDPRNPATIADNVGDNVGDVAGMGADLYESYCGSIIATAALGSALPVAHLAQMGMTRVDAVVAPLIIAGIGILLSIAGIFMVRTKEDATQKTLLRSLLIGTGGASVLVLAVVLGMAWAGYIAWGLFGSVCAGLVAGVIIGQATEYYTSDSYKPTRGIADQAKMGPATTIIEGICVGMTSTGVTVITIVLGILAAYWFAGGFVEMSAGLYGVSFAAVGMLSTLGITMATDAYGPIADNAGGNAEMAGLDPQVRTRTDALDSLGNTTAATGKGFAIGSAALTALALLASYLEEVRIWIGKEPDSAAKITLTQQYVDELARRPEGLEEVVAPDGSKSYKLEVPVTVKGPIVFVDTALPLEEVAIPPEVYDGVMEARGLEEKPKLRMTQLAKASIGDFVSAYDITLFNPMLLCGLFLGVMAAFVFAAMTMKAVGRAAGQMVEEVRRQFRSLTGIMDYTPGDMSEENQKRKPDYASCVSIATGGAQREMVLPALLGVAVPIVVGLCMGIAGVIGLLSGALVGGFSLATFLNNSGGAWDNAKKSIEAGAHGGKYLKNEAGEYVDVEGNVVASREEAKNPIHGATVIGDTVGDPFKDTSGPALNILIKLMVMVSVVFSGLVVLRNLVD
ncbi:MAG: sodium-translocating pyrophosphatase [Planctomycetota bacterium]